MVIEFFLRACASFFRESIFFFLMNPEFFQLVKGIIWWRISQQLHIEWSFHEKSLEL